MELEPNAKNNGYQDRVGIGNELPNNKELSKMGSEERGLLKSNNEKKR